MNFVLDNQTLGLIPLSIVDKINEEAQASIPALHLVSPPQRQSTCSGICPVQSRAPHQLITTQPVLLHRDTYVHGTFLRRCQCKMRSRPRSEQTPCSSWCMIRAPILVKNTGEVSGLARPELVLGFAVGRLSVSSSVELIVGHPNSGDGILCPRLTLSCEGEMAGAMAEIKCMLMGSVLKGRL